MPYFILGIIVKMNSKYLLPLILNKYCIAICCLSFIFTQYIENEYLKIVSVSIGIAAFTGIFFHIFKYEKINNLRASKALFFIGTSTLEIYLLHNFIILGLKKVFPILQNLKGLAGTIYEFPIYLVLALLITVFCIVLVNMMKKIKIYKYIFPSAVH